MISLSTDIPLLLYRLGEQVMTVYYMLQLPHSLIKPQCVTHSDAGTESQTQGLIPTSLISKYQGWNWWKLFQVWLIFFYFGLKLLEFLFFIMLNTTYGPLEGIDDICPFQDVGWTRTIKPMLATLKLNFVSLLSMGKVSFLCSITIRFPDYLDLTKMKNCWLKSIF